MAIIRSFLEGVDRSVSIAMERPFLRYLGGLSIFLLALVLRLAIFPVEKSVPFVTFFPAVTLAAFLCGFGPSLLVIGLSALAGDYIFMEPFWAFSTSLGSIVSVVVFALSGLLICLIVERGRRSEAEGKLLASVVTSSDNAILSKTLQGIITSWNPGAERLFGYAAKEVIGRSMAMLIPEDLLQEETHLLAEIANGESIERYETVRLRKDGSRLELSVNLSPVRDRFGVIVGASNIAHDISERRKLEENLRQSNQGLTSALKELERSNKDLDEFAYIASHDLKEPLRGIHNYVSFLQEDFAQCLDQEGRNYLERIQRLAERLTVLIDTLLSYSRLGSAQMAMEPVDLNAVLDEVQEDIRSFLALHAVELRRGEHLPTVIGNAVRLGELLQNLVVNASKYNDKDAKWVEVGCDQTGAVPVFRVRDNGIGIPEQHKDNVFRIFKRLHEKVRFGGGTGAGLTIAKEIGERHGGQIWMESVVGEGTTFYFTLNRDLE